MVFTLNFILGLLYIHLQDISDTFKSIRHLQDHLQELIRHLQDISDTNFEFLEDGGLEDDGLEDGGYRIRHLQDFKTIFKIYPTPSSNFYTSG